MNISSSIVNHSQRSYFIVIIIYVFIIFIKSITLIIKLIIASPSSIFSKSIKIKIIRKHFKYKIIQKIFDDYKDLIISNLHNLSFNSLTKTFVVFILFTNHVNKLNIFKFTIYEQTIFNNLSRIN